MTIQINRRQFDDLVVAINDAEDNDVDVRDDYSGRAMYGSACIGYVGDEPVRFALELAAVIAGEAVGYYIDGSKPDVDDIRDAFEEIGSMRSDSMGRSSIWYWPEVVVAEVEAVVGS